ncbi:MAG: hypothetical protein K8U57_37810 [Planctomycetes bacterium]|nr:hypothetical protein [Planctomycetota bacterium]
MARDTEKQPVKARGRSAADESLAAALAAGKTVADAATVAGVSETTVYRRLREPLFRARVSELRGEMTSRAAGQLADGLADATAVLRSLLTSADEDVRFKTASKIIELSLRVREAVEIEDRLRTVEDALAAKEETE